MPSCLVCALPYQQASTIIMHMEMHGVLAGFCLEESQGGGFLSSKNKPSLQSKCKISSIVSGGQNSLSGNKRRLSGGTLQCRCMLSE